MPVSYVNAHRQADSYNDVFAGNAIATNSFTYYIRVAAADRNNPASKASIFYVQAFLDGAPLAVEFIGDVGITENNGRDPKGRYVTEVSNGAYAMYKITIANLTNTNSACTLRVMAANDYVIQYSYDGNFQDIYSPTKYVSDILFMRTAFADDFSNVRTHAHTVGHMTTRHTFGVRSMFYLLGMNFLYTGSVSVPYVKLPSGAESDPVKQSHLVGMYHSLELTGTLFDVEIVGDIYAVDRNYLTVFAPDQNGSYLLVDDNDNNDTLAGVNAQGEVLASDLPVTIDKNGNDVYDFQESFLGLQALPFFFRYNQDDRNNNDIPDGFEDDEYPDMKYRNGYYGGSLSFAYALPFFRFFASYYDDTSTLLAKTARKGTSNNSLWKVPLRAKRRKKTALRVANFGF